MPTNIDSLSEQYRIQITRTNGAPLTISDQELARIADQIPFKDDGAKQQTHLHKCGLNGGMSEHSEGSNDGRDQIGTLYWFRASRFLNDLAAQVFMK